ncbi:MAG: hypothetical protein GWM90_17555 [Gemmatimonadetes bacterium]|nr:hypothetical protein [Gemmatimonadota bacterium]NIQ56159.1 hypothetical protein [Gemmatimonadota bacterium]NIU76346.1 hypothetical protein [Gammaproteobacteria bacterium]NIX45832.1 hypothetical protein [Gemmatimonadota bacterium]
MKRAVGLLTLALAVVACGDSGTEPPDNDVSGDTYALSTFAGSSLPLTQMAGAECEFGTGPDVELELQAAALTFGPATFLMDWTIRGRCTDTAGEPVGEWVDLSYSTTGAYTLDGDELMLDDPGAYGTWTGTAGGSELTLTTANSTVTVWTLQN